MASLTEILGDSPLLCVHCMYRRLALQSGKEQTVRAVWEATVAVCHGKSRPLSNRPRDTGQTCLIRFVLTSHIPALKGLLQSLGKHRRGSTVATHSTSIQVPATRKLDYRVQRAALPNLFQPPVVHTNMGSEASASGNAGPTAAATHRHLCLDMWADMLPCCYLVHHCHFKSGHVFDC